MTHPLSRTALFALILLGCAACEGETSNLRNDPDFQGGYAAGCAAANNAGTDYRRGPVRDEDLYKNSEAYRRGWGSGYSTCRGSQTPAPGASPVPEPSPGH